MNWIEESCDKILEENKGKTPLIIASGISPSGPIHLGNLREVLTAHFVVKELSQRGIEVRHLHFWDDWDRLRKLPYGVPLGWEQYLGQGLMDIPDFCSEHSSYAEHWKAEFREALKELNIETEEISQGEIYKKGMYDKEIGIALSKEKRYSIFYLPINLQNEQRRKRSKEESSGRTDHIVRSVERMAQPLGVCTKMEYIYLITVGVAAISGWKGWGEGL